MPHTRRMFEANELYELCPRTVTGLPFVATRYMKVIIEGVLARTQRNFKVEVCHYDWMANHLHLLLIALDHDELKNFYMELQKKLTDCVKRLLGVKHLRLWHGRPSVAKIDDLDCALTRIAYLYANPAAANLVDKIEQYPGVSTWEAWSAHKNGEVSASVSRTVPWVRAREIQELPFHSVTPAQDYKLEAKLKKAAFCEHELVVKPNLWMKRFGITTKEEVTKVNERLLLRLRENERRARVKRGENGYQPMGAKRLRSEPFMKAHTPKKNERRIFILASDPDRRKSAIKSYHLFCDRCRKAYELYRATGIASWPPGAFRPALPPLITRLADNQ